MDGERRPCRAHQRSRNPPRFVLVSRAKGADGVLKIGLDVPNGLSRQYFDAVIAKSDGKTEKEQLGEDGLSSAFASDNVPTSVRIVLPVFEVIGEPVKLDPDSGYSLRFRFDPNDLGKVDFRATPLKIVNGGLVLERVGRTIRFRRCRP